MLNKVISMRQVARSFLISLWCECTQKTNLSRSYGIVLGPSFLLNTMTRSSHACSWEKN
uniref:Uncharacterized protein n=1 Tax=Arundo donax TaxID=35708 RepID=A0A0A9ACJ9_ARUDO